MAEGTPNSIVNLSELSKPADTLIKKIKRIAKAEAEAAILKTETDIRITDLHQRAMHRFIEEEAKFQQNMEEITAKALPLLTKASNPDAMEDDWITNFFDKCRIVSDAEMQALWSRVLVGEANNPGSFSNRTINLISDMDMSDASLFAKFCGFVWQLESPDDHVPIIFLRGHGMEFELLEMNRPILRHLETIGLVKVDTMAGFHRDYPEDKKFTAHYYGRPLQLSFKDGPQFLPLGDVDLTKAGRELLPICGGSPVTGFWDLVLKIWRNYV
jgi:hypothetical protein